jgi:hypothetical protein
VSAGSSPHAAATSAKTTTDAARDPDHFRMVSHRQKHRCS